MAAEIFALMNQVGEQFASLRYACFLFDGFFVGRAARSSREGLVGRLRGEPQPASPLPSDQPGCALGGRFMQIRRRASSRRGF